MDQFNPHEHFRTVLPGDPDPDAAGDRSGCLPFWAPGEVALVEAAWLVKGLIPQTGLTVVYGPSGSGKSFVTLDLAMAVSRGEPWRGRKTEPGAVLYLAPDGGGLFANRLLAYAQHRGIASGEHSVFSTAGGINLLATGGGCDADAVLRTIDHIEATYGVSVAAVVIDTASRSMPGGDENAARDVTRLVENLARIGDGKRGLIVVHHSGKDLAQGMRGHSALHAAADCVLKVHDGQIETVKSRDGEAGMVGGFRLEKVELGTDEDGDPITSCVVQETDADTNRHVGYRRTMSHADQVAMRTISNLIAEHGEPLPQGTGFPTSGRHVGVSVRLVSQVLRGSLFADRAPEAAQKAWERLRNKLNAAGLIVVNGGWIWLPDHRETDGYRHFSDMSETVGSGAPDDEKPTDTDTTPRGCRMSVVGRRPTPTPVDGASHRAKAEEGVSVTSVRAAESAAAAHRPHEMRH